MYFHEEIKNLFDVQITEIDDDGYYLAHCISADFALGAGIAKEFDKRFNLKEELNMAFPTYMNMFLNDYFRYGVIGDCILCGEVFNLVTKERYFHKPTLKSLERSLSLMKRLCKECHIKKIAMPRIGCGLDKLQWEDVGKVIQKVFNDTDVEILICVQPQKKGNE